MNKKKNSTASRRKQCLKMMLVGSVIAWEQVSIYFSVIAN